MSIAEETKALVQQSRDLERAALVQICHLVRLVVPQAKTFVVTTETEIGEPSWVDIDVPARSSDDNIYPWTDELSKANQTALGSLERILSGAPKFQGNTSRTITIAKLLGESDESTETQDSDDLSDVAPEYDDSEPIGVRRTREGGWAVSLHTDVFRGSLRAMPLEDGEFFIEIDAHSDDSSTFDTIEATGDPGDPGSKFKIKVVTRDRSATAPINRARAYVEAMLDKAREVEELRSSIDALGEFVITVV